MFRIQSPALNGTYNAEVFTDETIRLIRANGKTGPPMFFYLAYQNVHLACGGSPSSAAVPTGKPHGLQAPCASVDLYATSVTDQIKVQGAMVTELDYGVGNVTAELVRQGMWGNSVIFMVADNGAQMDHGKNWPLRGGKHTFWEGGVRVVCWISSPLIPAARRGTIYTGIAHSSDWVRSAARFQLRPMNLKTKTPADVQYVTLVEGVAGGDATRAKTGPRPPDATGNDGLFRLPRKHGN